MLTLAHEENREGHFLVAYFSGEPARETMQALTGLVGKVAGLQDACNRPVQGADWSPELQYEVAVRLSSPGALESVSQVLQQHGFIIGNGLNG